MRTLEAVVIGTSAGALEALTAILPNLPKDYPLAVMVVVHLPADKKSMLTELFVNKCQMPVKEAEDKERIRSGTIYFAPPDYHLLVEQDKSLSLSSEEPVLYSRPSIDVLFETAADAYGEGLIGVVMTGANEDGARGLKTIINAGGIGIVQSPEQAFSSTMPLAALKNCPSVPALPLDQIAILLKKAILP